MWHPPGPSILYPECKYVLEKIFEGVKERDEELIREGLASAYASGVPNDAEAVIETPPEWGAPDEGNPNQPRRPPEYQPPQVSYATPLTTCIAQYPKCLHQYWCCPASQTCIQALLTASKVASDIAIAGLVGLLEHNV